MRQLHVAGAGRHVDDEDIELVARIAPGDVAHHLVEGGDHHRPAPDDRRALVDQEAHRHHLDAEVHHRHEAIALHPRLAGKPEQARLRWAVDVGIEDAHLESDRLEAEGEIDGGGRLADAALAGCDRDDMANAGYWRTAPGRWSRRGRSSPAAVAGGAMRARLLDTRMLRRGALARPGSLGGQHRGNALDSLELGDDRLGGLAQRLELCSARRVDRDRKIGTAVLDQDIGNEAKVDDVAFQVRPLDPAQ